MARRGDWQQPHNRTLPIELKSFGMIELERENMGPALLLLFFLFLFFLFSFCLEFFFLFSVSSLLSGGVSVCSFQEQRFRQLLHGMNEPVSCN